MSHRILIVEDEALVALELEATLDELGHEIVGIAPDSSTALKLVGHAPDVALVDINLRDGPTGITLGTRLAQEFGVNVLFVTANPRSLADGIPGTIGVLPKPYSAEDVKAVMNYLAGQDTVPAFLKIFSRESAA